MPVNSTHSDYDASLPAWLRARDVLAGEDAVKAGGEKYLPRLDSQSDEEFAAYLKRASFFNATGRTAEAYIGMVFRRPPFLKLPNSGVAAGRALKEFSETADMLGTSLVGYAKNLVGDVLGWVVLLRALPTKRNSSSQPVGWQPWKCKHRSIEM